MNWNAVKSVELQSVELQSKVQQHSFEFRFKNSTADAGASWSFNVDFKTGDLNGFNFITESSEAVRYYFTKGFERFFTVDIVAELLVVSFKCFNAHLFKNNSGRKSPYLDHILRAKHCSFRESGKLTHYE